MTYYKIEIYVDGQFQKALPIFYDIQKAQSDLDQRQIKYAKIARGVAGAKVLRPSDDVLIIEAPGKPRTKFLLREVSVDTKILEQGRVIQETQKRRGRGRPRTAVRPSVYAVVERVNGEVRSTSRALKKLRTIQQMFKFQDELKGAKLKLLHWDQPVRIYGAVWHDQRVERGYQILDSSPEYLKLQTSDGIVHEFTVEELTQDSVEVYDPQKALSQAAVADYDNFLRQKELSEAPGPKDLDAPSTVTEEKLKRRILKHLDTPPPRVVAKTRALKKLK